LIAWLHTIEKSRGPDAPKRWNITGLLVVPAKEPELGQGLSLKPSGFMFCVVAETEPLELTLT
jgi:hypothetical protein